jgi:hypothetical protein
MTPLLLLALAAGPELEPYEVEGKFVASFPVPATKSVKVESGEVNTEHGKLRTKTYKAEYNRKLMLSVGLTDYPENFAKTDADAFLKAAKDGIRTKNVTIDSEKKLAADEHNPAGLELDYDLDKYRSKVRLYKHKTRLFVVSTTGDEQEVSSDAAKKFLASFRVK